MLENVRVLPKISLHNHSRRIYICKHNNRFHSIVIKNNENIDNFCVPVCALDWDLGTEPKYLLPKAKPNWLFLTSNLNRV